MSRYEEAQVTDPVPPRGAVPADDPATTAGHARRRSVNIRPANWLLLIPLIGTLIPPFYNFKAPTIGGMPFFYWYQLVWIALSVLITFLVYRATRGER